MTLSEIFFSQNWILSLIFLLLIIISISSWYIIFHKALFFKKEESSLKNGAESDSNSALKESFAEIQKSQNQDKLDRKLSIIFENLRAKASFGQNFLASIANLTPFIGLFGTVLGVYFALIDISNQGNASISTVAAPIGEALIATAIGLWCAIPAAFAYNYFSKKSQDLVKSVKLKVEQKILEK